MSSLRSQDGVVADHPQIERCQHTDYQANNHVRIQGSCYCSEAKQPGRKNCPNAERKVDPLLPLSERKESAEGNERNRCSDDPGISSRRHLTREAKRPGGEHQAKAEYDVHKVNRSFFGFACPNAVGHLLSP